MTVELTGEQAELVLRLAHQSGRTPEEVVMHAVTNMDDAAELKLMEERIAEADSDAAQWLSHEEVGRRVGLR
jgi:hypothetical protein